MYPPRRSSNQRQSPPTQRPVRHSQSQTQSSPGPAPTERAVCDDARGPLQLSSLDTRSLGLADWNIVRTPEGQFYRLERIEAFASHSPQAPLPTSLPHLNAEVQNSGSVNPSYQRTQNNNVIPCASGRRNSDRNEGIRYENFNLESPKFAPRYSWEISQPVYTSTRSNSWQPEGYTYQAGATSKFSVEDQNVSPINQVSSVGIETTLASYGDQNPFSTFTIPEFRQTTTESTKPSHISQLSLPTASWKGRPSDVDPCGISSQTSQRTSTQNYQNDFTFGTGFYIPHDRNVTQAASKLPSASPTLSGLRISDEMAANAPIYVGSDRLSVSSSDVAPGEVLIYEGNVKRSSSFSSLFESAFLKVFRHTITKELRFHTRTTSSYREDTESFKMRYDDAELIPTYAYDISKGNALYLRETTAKARSSIKIDYSEAYEFPTLKALVEFQGKILGEEVYLDISSLRFANIVKRGNSHRRVDFVRLQIWHGHASGSDRDDTGSIMTSGTVLSGPLKERTMPAISRLILFLGRAEEYISIFITDDITLKGNGPTSVNLWATKYSGIDLLKSRSGIKCQEVPRGSCAAGIPLSTKGMEPDNEDAYAQFKTIQLEFEDERSLTSFHTTWESLLRLRRSQRLSIQNTRNEMARRVYSGAAAAKII